MWLISLFYAIVCLSWHARSLVGERYTEADFARLCRLLDPFCQHADIPIPKISILETPATNAFAAGVLRRTQSVGVTRGALAWLDDRELQAVVIVQLVLRHVMRRRECRPDQGGSASHRIGRAFHPRASQTRNRRVDPGPPSGVDMRMADSFRPIYIALTVSRHRLLLTKNTIQRVYKYPFVEYKMGEPSRPEAVL